MSVEAKKGPPRDGNWFLPHPSVLWA
jgi:hypothetical protein